MEATTKMDFFFAAKDLERAVPAETRILVLSAEPYPDRGRLRVHLEVTPFQKRPYIAVTLRDVHGNEVAVSSILEPLSWKLEFTMHLRLKADPSGDYILEARLYFPDGPEAPLVRYDFTIPAAE